MTEEQMYGLYMTGDIEMEELKEWLSLNARLDRLERIQHGLNTGDLDPRKGMSQADIAAILGISQQAVSKYLRSGKNHVRKSLINKEE